MRHIPGTLAVWWWWRGKPRTTGICMYALPASYLVTLQVFANDIPGARYKNPLRQIWHNGLFASITIPKGV